MTTVFGKISSLPLFFVIYNCVTKWSHLDNRNKFLAEKGLELPKFKKTGTTIAGVIFKDGVVLGADTRATEGSTVADKDCQKIHYLNKNM